MYIEARFCARNFLADGWKGKFSLEITIFFYRLLNIFVKCTLLIFGILKQFRWEIYVILRKKFQTKFDAKMFM